MAHLHQINVSDGGVPKLPIESAEIDVNGIVGDRQADQVHHGGPDQALCLYSLDVIDRLREEGHPIEAGAAGENLTISGLDWNRVVPGTLLDVGAVRIEITHFTTPCAKNAAWFVDGRFNRMHHSKHPGESRVYARVITGGRVQPGDPVALAV